MLNDSTKSVDSQSITMPQFVTGDSSVDDDNQSNTKIPVQDININTNTNTVINPNFSANPSTDVNNVVLYNTTSNINNEPVRRVNTNKKTVKINPELKTAIIMAVVILITILLIPTLFSLFDSLRNKFIG